MGVPLRTKLRYTLLNFIHDSRSVGILLLCCTAISLVVSNLSIGKVYHDFWQTEIPVFHSLYLPHSIIHFINDALMAVFFFLAGMEIKREMLVGELSSVRQALLPIAAAVSGAVVPAAIFLLFNSGSEFQHGWAIPTATDIAFSLGIVALLGKKVPDSLRIFLTALAIIDDLIAIVVIALFYGEAINWMYFLGVIAVVILLFVLNKIAKQKLQWLRIILGIAMWFCMYHSGIHATVAGVLFALLLPKELLSVYEKRLHVFVNFFVIAVFVLANTSIVLPSNFTGAFGSALSWGIIVGLFIGKPLGIAVVCFLMIKSGWAKMPKGANHRQFLGVAILAGIGFTMSIFVSSLAYENTDVQSTAKIAVIAASFLAMITGFVWLKIIARRSQA